MGISEKDREKQTGQIFESIMMVNFSKLMSDYKSQIQEAHRIPSITND